MPYRLVLVSCLAAVLCQCVGSPDGAWVPVTVGERRGLKAGMRVEDVRAKIGLPYEVVLVGPGGAHEIHRYEMVAAKGRQQVEEYDWDREEWVLVPVPVDQRRILELHFVGGRLVAGEGPGKAANAGE